MLVISDISYAVQREERQNRGKKGELTCEIPKGI